MGMGIAICCVAPTGEATAIIENTEAGVIVPPGNPKQLAETLKTVSEHPNVLDDWGMNGYLARNKYTRENQAKLFIDSLSSLPEIWKTTPSTG